MVQFAPADFVSTYNSSNTIFIPMCHYMKREDGPFFCFVHQLLENSYKLIPIINFIIVNEIVWTFSLFMFQLEE